MLCKPYTKKEIKKDAKELLEKSTEFFANNPRRRVANVCVWYGRAIKIRKTHIEEDVNAAAEFAMTFSTEKSKLILGKKEVTNEKERKESKKEK